MKFQKKVIEHMKHLYEIYHEKARQVRKDQKGYHCLLRKENKFDFPPIPPLNSFEELKSDDENIFPSEDKVKTHQVNELYAVEPKADAWHE